MEFRQVLVVPAGLVSALDARERFAGPAVRRGRLKLESLLEKLAEKKGVKVDQLGALPMRAVMVLEELVTNIVWHDLLGLYGAERQILLEKGDKAPAELLEKFRRNAANAVGHEASLLVRLEESVIRICVALRNEFPEFPALWSRVTAEDYAPSVEELESSSGRGVLLIASFCSEGVYDDKNRTLDFAIEH